MTAEATARSRRNKRIGADAERRAAAIYGTERYQANTGGPVDLIEVDGVSIQVKAGATLTIATILDGLDSARIAAGAHGLAACHVEYHRKGKREHRKLIVFDAEEYAAWNGMGDIMRRIRDYVERIFERVEVEPKIGCWLYGGQQNSTGYGYISIRNKNHLVHRLTFEVAHGTISDGMTIDHLCRVKLCVNPAHLELVTRAENIRRASRSRPVAEYCRAGHSYTADNTYVQPSTGRRMCVACRGKRQSQWYARAKAARQAAWVGLPREKVE